VNGVPGKTIGFDSVKTIRQMRKTALNLDRKIISFDQAYDKVPGLKRIKPNTI